MTAPNRNRDNLHPAFRPLFDQLEAALAAEGLSVRFYEGLRGLARQEDGKKRGVSNASMWQSFHNWGLAADFVRIKAGRWNWGPSPLWARMGAIGEGLGLVWGGRFTRIRGGQRVPFFDGPHFQHPLLPRSALSLSPRAFPGLQAWADWTPLFLAQLDLKQAPDKRIFAAMIQLALNHMGADLVVDGVFGPKTNGALSAVAGCSGLVLHNWPALVRAVMERDSKCNPSS